MLLTKAAIGSRAFSNDNASRKKSAGELKQTLILQGVEAKFKKSGRTRQSREFCFLLRTQQNYRQRGDWSSPAGCW
jgi:hypothetical protein